MQFTTFDSELKVWELISFTWFYLVLQALEFRKFGIVKGTKLRYLYV